MKSSRKRIHRTAIGLLIVGLVIGTVRSVGDLKKPRGRHKRFGGLGSSGSGLFSFPVAPGGIDPTGLDRTCPMDAWTSSHEVVELNRRGPGAGLTESGKDMNADTVECHFASEPAAGESSVVIGAAAGDTAGGGVDIGFRD